MATSAPSAVDDHPVVPHDAWVAARVALLAKEKELTRLRDELSRVGGRPPSGDELSPTEQRVAALVATGRTNREVAEELFLSQHTVEWHLRRIYRKLAVRNRAELGAVVGRNGG